MEKKIKGGSVKNSNAVTGAKSVSNNGLAVIECEDATRTRGKVSAKCNIVEQANNEAIVEKIDKNYLFSVEVADYFCPVHFDASPLEAALTPLINSGIMSADAVTAAIEKNRKEFTELHAKEIEAANGLTFAEVDAKLQENETLYKKVLQVCGLSFLRESYYIEDGKVKIYRPSQCLDKEGKEKYKDATLTTSENGVTFSVPLFIEYREINTSNILLAIRYYNSYLEAAKKLLNKVSDYKRILFNVAEATKRAKENGFTLEQVLEQVTKVFG